MYLHQPFRTQFSAANTVALLWTAAFCLTGDLRAELKFESIVITNGAVPIKLNLAHRTRTVDRHPVILMLGAVKNGELPTWSTNLVNEGFMLAAFSAAHAPDPDPARRPQWLFFDQRFAHSYVLGARRAISDSRAVIDYLVARGDVHPEKIGWLGSSSTGIPGLAVATQGPRLAAIVAFVSTGAYEQWFDTWHANRLWQGKTKELWPETRALLDCDPIRHADTLFPTAVLMVSGGADKVVDPKTARAFGEAARPFYKSDPDRLRLVVYEGFGHNLPADVIRLHAEHWFRLYMDPTSPPPPSAEPPATVDQGVLRSQITAAEHRKVVGADEGNAAQLDWIKVSAGGRGFVADSSGQRFVPWGFNYDRDYKMRLLEEYWESEWATVIEDFREMKALGANVVRVHLQLGKFMDAADTPNTNALHHLARLVRLAEDTGLHLDLTGLGCYRKADVPAWLDALSEAERWQVQARFWQAVARTCAHSPAIFCYDLINEPVVPAGSRRPGDWLVGQLAGFYYVQAISLDPAGRARSDVAKAWISTLVKAIRAEDKRHLITVGLLPHSAEASPAGSGFEPAKVTGKLDFLCVHLYPKTGELEQARQTLSAFQVGKPVVVEETFPLNCRPAELATFMRDAQADAAGWLSFYWGQTPEELANGKTIGEAMTREWLKVFRDHNPNAVASR